MAKLFEDKIALITGAASGIGRATARAFADEGARVIVLDVSTEAGHETVQLVEEDGGEAAFIKADVSQAEEVETAIQTIIETYGRLDIGINNAGIAGPWTRVADLSFDDWDQVLAINLNGVFYCMHYEIKQMLQQGAGVIVNTASVAGLRGLANASAYSASKHAVVGLTKAAALEYARQGIRVNAVCPVFTRTPLFEEMFELNPNYEEKLKRNIPMRRYGTPENIADAIVWLCSDAASFVTGQAVPLDGGMTAG